MTLDQSQKANEFDRWSGFKLAERASNLQQVREEGELVRANVKNLHDAYRQHHGLGDKQEEEEMGGVQVGDNITYHTSPQPQPKDDFLKKAVLYGGLLAAGAAGPWIAGKLATPSPQPQQKEVIQSTGPDTDTQYELRISSGDKQ